MKRYQYRKCVIIDAEEWDGIERDLELAHNMLQQPYKVILNPRKDGAVELLGITCNRHNYGMLPLDIEGHLHFVCKECSPETWPDAFEALTNGTSRALVREPEPKPDEGAIWQPAIKLPKECRRHGRMESGVMRKGVFSYLCPDCEAEERIEQAKRRDTCQVCGAEGGEPHTNRCSVWLKSVEADGAACFADGGNMQQNPYDSVREALPFAHWNCGWMGAKDEETKR